MPGYFTFQSSLHCAIIMDGNGRWATARGLPRIAGHRAGAEAVRRTIEAAPGSGIGVLTLFAFSSDNWQRPALEVEALMKLLGEHIATETGKCAEKGVRLEFIGRRDRLGSLARAMRRAEEATAHCGKLSLRIAVDYSARDAIARAASSGAVLAERLGPPVDLLIRTGGEQRLSDFLLWECAYAELIFTRRMWPEFDAADLEAAVREFRSRQRRFGKVPEASVRMNGNVSTRPESWLD